MSRSGVWVLSFILSGIGMTAQAQTARPKLLMLKRSDLQIKFIIDNWNLGSNY